MSQAARSTPPTLDNFEYRSWLGGGGYADVFLYDQLRPARSVAVKVLRSGSLGDADLSSFDAEANVMARVSAHPYIVSVFEAAVAADGRPYLVMEYYSEPHFGRRARGSGLAVAEVLKVAIRVASAVETAHRAGVLHRDIKPANILVNDYGRPGLTDFGIAGDRSVGALVDAMGYSVPYAPPEVLSETRPGDERSDVYSLGATLYALIAGRAPYEVVGGDNSAQAVTQRTLRDPVPAIGRADVPRNLELLVAQAMAKDPQHRPGSAAELGRALQGIERDLHLTVTDFELAGGVVTAPPLEPDADDEESTRAGRIQVVRQAERVESPTPPPADETAARGGSRPAPAPVASPDTVARATPSDPAPPPAPDSPADKGRPRRGLVVGGAVAALLVVVGVVAVVMSGGGDDPADAADTTSTTTPDPSAFVSDVPDVPTDVEVVVTDGVALVTWDPGDAQEVDTYVVERTDAPGTTVETDEPRAEVSGIEVGEVPCFAVTAVRTLGQPTSAPSTPGCADG
jgi:eukaryotic-like serine/threonine-protein kinase